jgi:hypothetical protein
MNCDDWLQTLTSRGLLATLDASSSEYSETDLMLVDGNAAVDQSIGQANSPHKLTQMICCDVEALATTSHAAEVFIHFDRSLALPFARDQTWDATHDNELRTYIGMHNTHDLRRRFSSCLHGDARTTEWPRPILKSPASRLALWRHPLFEWQLVHAITNDMMTWPLYPPTLRSLTAVGVPRLSQLDKWDDTWSKCVRTVGRIYDADLDAVQQRNGPDARAWAKDLLTMLHLGYGNLGARQWTLENQELISPTEFHSFAADVSQQMAQILYISMERRAQSGEHRPLTAFVTKARDEALPALLLVLHRAHESGHALRLIVQWAKPRPSVDLTATYMRLRQHLTEQGNFTVPDLYMAMMMQGARGVGARERETASDLVWTALHQEHVIAFSMLSSFRSRMGDAFPAKNSLSGGWSDGSPAYYDWCIAHVACKNFAAVALAVSAYRFLETTEKSKRTLHLTRDRRESDAYVHVCYRKNKETLPAAWQEAPPLTPGAALARARRACWFLEYACAASCPKAQSLVCAEAFTQSDNGTSVWGFQWFSDRALIMENRLFDALFSAELRLRSSPLAGPLHPLEPLEFGHLRLEDNVTLM